jgi:hypothetical protein
MIRQRVFMLLWLWMFWAPMLRQPMSCVAIESLALIAHLPNNLAHERHRREGPAGEGLGMLVLHTGGLRGRRLTLNALLQHPRHAVVQFALLMLIRLNGKLCTLILLKKASLILQAAWTRKMFDVLCLWCNGVELRLICTVLCAFTRVFVFCFVFTYFHRVYLCLPPSSRFSTLLWALVFPFDANWCVAFV